MILARNVSGADGSLLLEKGLSLLPEHIELLSASGHGSVMVQPAQAKLDQQRVVNQCADYVRSFFIYVDPDSPVLNEIFRLTLEQTVTAVQKGWDLPCQSELKAYDVEHLDDLFLIDEGSPDDIVTHETNLVSFPDIYFKIKEVLDSPSSSADDIARVVNTDMSLTARLLKLVNSPFFGFPTTIDSVARAVSLIGVRELSTLALGISAINFFKDIPPELISMKVFWRHSLSCAVFGKLIAAKANLPAERFFTAGLLHDAGRLILFKNMPRASTQALLFARNHLVPLVDAENQVMAYDHTTLGRRLLEAWQFPGTLTDIIAHHHTPMAAASPREAAVIQLADNLANAAEISAGGMFVLPGMDVEAWDLLGLNIREIKHLFASHARNIDEIVNSFL
jgi:putative nucleotidyltransferase with HDIG domain